MQNSSYRPEQLSIPIEGMTCAACVVHVENALRDIEGIESASVNLSSQKALINFEYPVSPSTLQKALIDSGYQLGMETTTMVVAGMTCGACVTHVEAALLNVPGVTSASVNLATETASVRFIPGLVDIAHLTESVAESGYQLIPTTNSSDSEEQRLSKRKELKEIRTRLIYALIGALLLFSLSFDLFPWAGYLKDIFGYQYIVWAIATPIQFWTGWSFYSSGIRALRSGVPNMYTLIALGTSVAYIYSSLIVIIGAIDSNLLVITGKHQTLYFHTSAIIIALVLLGRYMEARSLSQTSEAIRGLIHLQPRLANLERDSTEVSVLIGEVQTEDIVIIRPGETIPVDGVVLEGFSAVNEAMITGESIPVDKTVGQEVYAGTTNHNGSFKFRASRVGSNTVLSSIIRLVEQAQGSKAPIQRLADKVSAYFVPTIGVLGLISFGLWLVLGPPPAITIATTVLVSVLIIACPCALGLATPTAIIVGIGNGARKGILIHSAEALETLHKTDIVLMDKTGTLTYGKPSLTDILLSPDIPYQRNDILTIAATAERLSEHPIGKAIVEFAITEGIQPSAPTNFKALPGTGIMSEINGTIVHIGNEELMRSLDISVDELALSAQTLSLEGKTSMYISIDQDCMGVLGVSDTVRATSKSAVTNMKNSGLTVIMLTGDNLTTAGAVANQAGIDLIHASMLPAGKVKIIQDLQSQGNIVTMIGDGINDAAALTQADVGISMGSGSDIAISSSDITLARNDLTSASEAFQLSHSTIRTIKQNLFWAFFYNVTLIPIAAGAMYPIFQTYGSVPIYLAFMFGEFGFLNPAVAACAMAFSSVTVIGNSLRLKKTSAS